jgi:hypothetical protein
MRLFLIIFLALVTSSTSAYHCVGSQAVKMEQGTEAAKRKIKIERSELLEHVEYKIEAPKYVDKQEIFMVWFHFGFGKHPEGTIPVRHFEKGGNVEIYLNRFSKGIRGCLEIQYGERCGPLPQVIVTYEEAYLNNTDNTVYCSFEPY